MRKFVSLLLSGAIAVSLLSVVPFGAHAVDSNTPSKAGQSSYVYPVVPGSKEWADFTNADQKRAVCQIPDRVLKNMSTEQLTDAVLNYPLYGDYIAFDSLDMGYKVLSNNFNGIRELKMRGNAGSCLVNQLKKRTLLKSSNALNDADQDFLKDGYIKMLLSQNDFQGSMTSDDINVITSYNAACVDKLNAIYLSPATLKRNAIKSEVGITTVKTPRGTDVSVYILGEQLNSDRKKSINDYYDSAYPQARRIGQPTTNYNCHSFAWYSQSQSNKYWMNDPSNYWNDGSYSRYYVHNGGIASVNTRIEYYGSGSLEHSAVVTGRYSGPLNPNSYNDDMVIVTSKWGEAGLYTHRATDSPYTRNLAYYK